MQLPLAIAADSKLFSSRFFVGAVVFGITEDGDVDVASGIMVAVAVISAHFRNRARMDGGFAKNSICDVLIVQEVSVELFGLGAIPNLPSSSTLLHFRPSLIVWRRDFFLLLLLFFL